MSIMDKTKYRKKIDRLMERDIPSPPVLSDFYDTIDQNIPSAPTLKDFYFDPVIETNIDVPDLDFCDFPESEPDLNVDNMTVSDSKTETDLRFDKPSVTVRDYAPNLEQFIQLDHFESASESEFESAEIGSDLANTSSYGDESKVAINDFKKLSAVEEDKEDGVDNEKDNAEEDVLVEPRRHLNAIEMVNSDDINVQVTKQECIQASPTTIRKRRRRRRCRTKNRRQSTEQETPVEAAQDSAEHLDMEEEYGRKLSVEVEDSMMFSPWNDPESYACRSTRELMENYHEEQNSDTSSVAQYSIGDYIDDAVYDYNEDGTYAHSEDKGPVERYTFKLMLMNVAKDIKGFFKEKEKVKEKVNQEAQIKTQSPEVPVEMNPKVLDSTDSNAPNVENSFKVIKIFRTNEKMGITLASKLDSSQVIYVTADEAGFQLGDIILSLNGISCNSLTHDQFIELLKVMFQCFMFTCSQRSFLSFFRIIMVMYSFK